MATEADPSPDTYRRLVAKALPLLDDWVDSWARVPFTMAMGDPANLVARSSIVRQLSALKAAIVLIESGFGDLAVSFVRTSVEEFLWLKYTASLERSTANELVEILGLLEVGANVVSQQQWWGKKRMKQEGFSARFVKDITAGQADLRVQLKAIGERLAWPEESVTAGTSPPTAWVATQVGESAFYQFMYGASSKAIHFSPSEALRRCWGELDGLVTIRTDASFVAYRGSFALCWCLASLIETMQACEPFLDEHERNAEVDDPWSEAFLQVISELGKYPRVPIILPQEVNLHKTGWPPQLPPDFS